MILIVAHKVIITEASVPRRILTSKGGSHVQRPHQGISR
jgi:hypothetical protein